MTIKNHLFYLELLEPFGIARSTYSRSESFFVNIDGGWGEGVPSRFFGEEEDDVAAKLRECEALALADLDDIDGVLGAIDAAVHPHMCAKTAIDMALHDRLCKKLGVPLHKYFGASASKEMVTSYTIGIDTPENMLRKVAAAQNYEILKIKLGRNLDNDLAIMRLVRDAVGEKRLRVDANCGWSLDEAKAAVCALADLGVEYVEQPLGRGKVEASRELQRMSPLPIYADEDIVTSADVDRFAGAVAGINIKLMKCGGLAEAMRIVKLARHHGMKIMVGGRIESSVAVTAAAHLGLLVDSHDLDANLLVSNDPFEGVTCDAAGCLTLPQGCGLGVKPRAEYASMFAEMDRSNA